MEITREFLIRYYSEQNEDEQRMYGADRLREHVQYFRLREIAAFAVKHLPFSPCSRLVDLGCGDGYATERALGGQARSSCVGIDLSLPKLRTMTGRLVRSYGLAADAEFVPLKSASFEIVLCLELLEHVLEPLALLKEIRRLMRRDARCIISAPADSLLQPALVHALSRLKHWDRRQRQFHEHLHFTSIARLRPMLDKARLQVVAYELVGFQHPLRAAVAARMPTQRLYSLERWVSRRFRFGSFGVGSLTFGNEYLLLCVRPL